MSDEIYDPTAVSASTDDLNPTEASFGKARFGEFRIVSMRGHFKAGSEVTLGGITYTDEEGEKPFIMKGFLPNRAGDPAVVVFQRVTRTQGDKAGQQFIVSKVVMTSADAYHKVVHPGLVATFGDLSRVPMNVWFWGKAEELEHGKPGKGREKPNTYLKMEAVYTNEAECRAAEKAFFEALGLNAGGGGSSNPYAEAGMFVPQAWVDAPDSFWADTQSVINALSLVTVTSVVPPAKFQSDPGIKTLINDLAYTADEAKQIFAIKDALLAVSQV